MADVAEDRTAVSIPAISRTLSGEDVAHETDQHDVDPEKVQDSNALNDAPNKAQGRQAAAEFPEGGLRAWATVIGAYVPHIACLCQCSDVDQFLYSILRLWIQFILWCIPRCVTTTTIIALHSDISSDFYVREYITNQSASTISYVTCIPHTVNLLMVML